MRKWLIGFVVCASLSGSRVLAADKADFDRGGQGLNIQRIADVQAAPEMPGPGVNPSYTFQVSPESRVYAKGLVKKNLPSSAWKHFQYRDVQIPNTFDLRPKLTQIENQGMCGSCWAFSLTSTHRDGHALGGKDPGRLSQEWLVDNSTMAAGCQGGYFDSAADFVEPGGQPLYTACPYTQGSGKKCAKDLPLAAHITAWHMMGDPVKGPSVKEIEAYMTISGKSVSIGVAAAAGSWQNYSGGIYNGCAFAELDHMINIVGWDNEGAGFDANGNLPPGKGVWILRNSWGKYWGEQGYMRSRMTDSAGKRCNAVAQEVAYFDF